MSNVKTTLSSTQYNFLCYGQDFFDKLKCNKIQRSNVEKQELQLNGLRQNCVWHKPMESSSCQMLFRCTGFQLQMWARGGSWLSWCMSAILPAPLWCEKNFFCIWSLLLERAWTRMALISLEQSRWSNLIGFCNNQSELKKSQLFLPQFSLQSMENST